MKSSKLILSAITLSIILSGCVSVFMPYKDEFKCNKGIGEGTCASMSENYKSIHENKKEKEKIMVLDNNQSCKKCEIDDAIWLKQRALEKRLDEIQGANK